LNYFIKKIEITFITLIKYIRVEMLIVLLSLLNIIVYASKPACNSCKWFIPNINNDYGRCKLYLQSVDKNPPTFPIYKFSKICRENESLCGKDGRFYENKELDNKSNYIKQLMNDYSTFINKK